MGHGYLDLSTLRFQWLYFCLLDFQGDLNIIIFQSDLFRKICFNNIPETHEFNGD